MKRLNQTESPIFVIFVFFVSKSNPFLFLFEMFYQVGSYDDADVLRPLQPYITHIETISRGDNENLCVISCSHEMNAT